MILMQAPGPNENFGAMPSGATYVSNAQSLIFINNNSTADQAALASAGCVTLSPAGFWGAGTFNLLSDLYAADAMTAIFLPGLVGFPAHMPAAVQADPTASNNGLWYKTGTGNGAGNWTQTSATLTPNANVIQAAANATAAQVAAAAALVSQGQAAAYAASVAAAGAYSSAYATALPQGLTAINIGGTAITGATPGTYALTPVGGSLTGVVANLIVTSATAATIQIVNTGVGTGTIPPTFANPAGATLPAGTTLTGVVGTLIANQKPYWVVSSDGTQLLLYGNNAGAVASYPFGGIQGSLLCTPSLTALVSALSTTQYQYIGRPLGSVLVDSSTLLTGSTVINNAPAVAAATLQEFDFVAHVTGIIKFKVYGPTGTYISSSAPVTISTTGPQTLTPANFGVISIPAGGYIGWYSAACAPGYVSGIGQDNPQYSSLSGDTTGAWTPGSNLFTNIIAQARYTLSYLQQSATASAEATDQANIAALQLATAGLNGISNPAQQSYGITNGSNPIAIAYTTVDGSSIAVSTPANAAINSASGTIWVAQAGTIQFIKGTISGTTFTRTGCSTPIALASAGANAVSFPAGFTLAPGEYLFVYTPKMASGGCGLIYTNNIQIPAPLLLINYEAVTGSTIASFAGLTFGIALTFNYSASILTAPNYSAIDKAARRSSFKQSLLASGYTLDAMVASRWYHGLEYGQSNSNGTLTGSVISATQPYANLTFGAGVRSVRPGNSWGAVYTAPGTSTSTALVEVNTDASADGNAVGVDQESPCSGEANWFTRLAIKRGAVPSSHIVFQSAPGHGSYAISQLNKASTWYANLRSHVVDAKALATAAGVGYTVQTVSWIQGEQDASVSTSYATYLAALLQLASDMNTDLRSDAGGQTTPIHMLVAGVGACGTVGQLAYLNGVQQAQLDACAQSPLIHFVTPMYPFYYPFSSGLHMYALGAIRLGRWFGRARDQLVHEQRSPDFLQPLSATVAPSGTVLTVKYNVPTVPLVLDSTQLPLATNYGIKVVDDTGTLTLSNIVVNSDGTSLSITLNRALSTNPFFRIGLDYQGSPGYVISLGCTSNLRDSTGDFDTCTVLGTTYRMDHWSPTCKLAIVTLE